MAIKIVETDQCKKVEPKTGRWKQCPTCGAWNSGYGTKVCRNSECNAEFPIKGSSSPKEKKTADNNADLDKLLMEFILLKHGGSITKARKALEAIDDDKDAALKLAYDCGGKDAALGILANLETRANG